MNTTRSTAPGMRLVAAALTATIAAAGLGLSALAFADEGEPTAEASAEQVVEDAAEEQAANASIEASSLTSDQAAADEALANATAADSVVGVALGLTNDVDQAAQLYDAVDALRSESGLGTLGRDGLLESAAYQRAAESTLLATHVRPDGSLFSTASGGRATAEILVRAGADGATDASTVLAALTDEQRALLTAENVTNIGIGMVVDDAGTAYWAIELAVDGADGGTPETASGATTYLVDVTAGNVQVGTADSELSVEADTAQTIAIPVTVTGDIAYGSGTASFSDTSATLSNAGLTWNSSDPAVASVDASGTVTGVGSGTCTISGTGTAGSFIFSVTVTGGEPASSTVNLADCTIAGIVASYEATGEPIEPRFTVIDPDNSTVDPSQYTYTYTDNVEPGTATLTITAVEGASVTGSATRTFEIVGTTQVEVPSVLGSSIEEATESVSVSGLETTLVEGEAAPDAESAGTVYETSPAEGELVDAGASVTLVYYAAETEGEDADEGSSESEEQTSEEGTEDEQAGEDTEAEDETQADTIDITGHTINAIANQTYTGEAIEPDVTLSGTQLTEGVDYTVSYDNNVNVGTATVRVTGIGAYSGELTATFQIVGDIADAQISIPDQTYDGTELTPTPTVQLGDTILTANTDYEVTYSNNVNAGTATATITGKGSYTGTTTVEFTIAAKSIKGNAQISPIATATYTGSAITPEVTVTDGTTVLVNGTDYTVSYDQNTDAGTAHVVVTGTGNYCDSIDTTFVIAPVNMSSTTIVMPNMNYTGQALTPKPVSVTVGDLVLVEGTDYEIVGYSSNTNVGNATVTLQGKGNFTGTVTANWKIVQQDSTDTGTTETLPQTGDSTNIAAMAVGAVVGVALVIIAIVLIVRRVRSNKRTGH